MVEKRDGNVLNLLILKYVEKGSIIIKDCWKGYNTFKNTPKYIHHLVNHSISFKNEDGLHTNNIKRTWNGIKMKIKPHVRNKRKTQGYFLSLCGVRKTLKIFVRFLYML